MIELAQSLGCWPPNLFSNPLGHLLEELGPVVSYPVMDSDSAIDLLGDLRRRLELLQSKVGQEEDEAGSLQELYMRGDFERAAKTFLARADQDAASTEDREIAAWSFIMWGNALSERAKQASGGEALELSAQAGEKYRTALAIKPDRYEALSNWGNLLLNQARRGSEKEAPQLLADAGEKYLAALAIKPDYHLALYSWCSTLIEQGKRAKSGEATQFFQEADEKLAAAVKMDPSKTYNTACLAALRGDENRCRENLESAEKYKTLPSAEHLVADRDLDIVRDKPWFQELVRRRKVTTVTA